MITTGLLMISIAVTGEAPVLAYSLRQPQRPVCFATPLGKHLYTKYYFSCIHPAARGIACPMPEIVDIGKEPENRRHESICFIKLDSPQADIVDVWLTREKDHGRPFLQGLSPISDNSYAICLSFGDNPDSGDTVCVYEYSSEARRLCLLTSIPRAAAPLIGDYDFRSDIVDVDSRDGACRIASRLCPSAPWTAGWPAEFSRSRLNWFGKIVVARVADDKLLSVVGCPEYDEPVVVRMLGRCDSAGSSVHWEVHKRDIEKAYGGRLTAISPLHTYPARSQITWCCVEFGLSAVLVGFDVMSGAICRSVELEPEIRHSLPVIDLEGRYAAFRVGGGSRNGVRVYSLTEKPVEKYSTIESQEILHPIGFDSDGRLVVRRYFEVLRLTVGQDRRDSEFSLDERLMTFEPVK
jgi:hypothetical protein